MNEEGSCCGFDVQMKELLENDMGVSLAWNNEEIIRYNNEIKSKTTSIRLPDLSHYSFKELLGRSPTIEEHYEQHKDEKRKCVKFESRDPNSEKITYYFGSGHNIKKEDSNDLYRIVKSEKIYSSKDSKYKGDFLIYYSERENAITVILQSSDILELIKPGSDITRGERNWDQANIKIYLDENHDQVSMMHYLTTEMSLSRTAISMLLEDAGINLEYKILYKALFSFLVLRRADDMRRTIEKNDCKIVPLQTVKKVNRDPNKANPQDIEVLEDFHYYKSRTVRKFGLNALERIMNVKRISKQSYEKSQLLFEFRDIDEDILFVERMLIQESSPESSLFETVLSGVSGEKLHRDDLDYITINWFGNGKNKNVYRMNIF